MSSEGRSLSALLIRIDRDQQLDACKAGRRRVAFRRHEARRIDVGLLSTFTNNAPIKSPLGARSSFWRPIPQS